MAKMSNLSRHRKEDTLEWFYNEWHGEHVDIMRNAPGLMLLLKRYVQNPALVECAVEPPLPFAPEGWEAMSQIHFNSMKAFVDSFSDPDYINGVRSHQLSDPDVVITMLTEEELVIDGDVQPDSVKAAFLYHLRDEADQAAFRDAWLRAFDPADLTRLGVVRYVRNHPVEDVADGVLAGSRFEGVKRNEFAAYDEFLFADQTALERFLGDDQIRAAIDQLNREYLSPRSLTYLAREIVQINNESKVNA